ncbi:MAG: hypothetical protein HON40_03815, partial [Flavobacteriales bacterium]|nr:hypothetical protein [Flavobacteriales bacterium]
DGKTKMEAAYKTGKREGKQIFYHPNGAVYYKGLCTEDKKSGIWEYFTKEGVSDTIINYNE